MKTIKLIIPTALLFFTFAFNAFSQGIAEEDDFYRAAETSNYAAVEFFKIIEEHNKEANIYFAPFALYVACAMLFEGASDKTYDEFLNIFYFPDDLVKRREIFLSWIKSKDAVVKNSFWLSSEYDFLNTYKIVLEKYYSADFNAKVDFTKQSSFSKINKKIEGGAGSLPEGIFDAETQAVVVNTADFLGKWKDVFDKRASLTDDFYMSKGKRIKAKFLRREGRHLYFEDRRIQLLKLEFDKSHLSALFILPKQNKIHYAQQYLYKNSLKAILGNLTMQKAVVYIPEFNFYGLYDFADVIYALGIKSPQYVKISLDRPLITNLFHGTSIKVDYDLKIPPAKIIDVGASGETTKQIERDIPPFVFRADHPFIFMILDENDGKILFMGKVANPSE